VPSAAKQAAEKVASGQEPRPQRLKPHSKQCSYRSAEALRHPKSQAKSSFSATCKAEFKTMHLPQRWTAASPKIKRNTDFFREL
jgi:hypothetical protein